MCQVSIGDRIQSQGSPAQRYLSRNLHAGTRGCPGQNWAWRDFWGGRRTPFVSRCTVPMTVLVLAYIKDVMYDKIARANSTRGP